MKNHDLLKEKGSEMARGRVITSVALIVWQLHPRRSPHSGRPRTGAVRGLPGQAPQACFEKSSTKVGETTTWEPSFWPHFSLIAALLATSLRLMAKNRDLLEEKGSEMAREGMFACVARIVWQLHRRQSPHSGRPRTGVV